MISNFDPLDLPGSGFVIPKGASREDMCRHVADGLLALFPTILGEVTGSGTPHANLDAYASDITGYAGGTGYQTNNGQVNPKVTLYFKEDPLLASGDARLLIIYPGEDTGLGAAIMDTATAPADEMQAWMQVHIRHSSYDDYSTFDDRERNRGVSNQYDGPGNTFMSYPDVWGANPEDRSSISHLDSDVRCLAWGSKYFLHVQFMSRRGNRSGRGLTLWCLDPPGDGRWARDPATGIPSIFYFDVLNDWYENYSRAWEVWRPQMPDENRYHVDAHAVYGEWGDAAPWPDASGRDLVSRLHFKMTAPNHAFDTWIDWIPHLKVVTDRGYVQDWATFTHDGVDYTVLNKRNSVCFLLPHHDGDDGIA